MRLKNLYEAAVASNGDPDRVGVLADCLEDEGHLALAAAYRWAAERNKWPFERAGRRNLFVWFNAPITQDRLDRVHDWDLEYRKSTNPRCQLPNMLFQQMRRLQGRFYAGVDQAFVLLANVLLGNKRYAELKAW